MLVYLDESYDNAHRFFLLGALFAPSPAKLHRAFRQVKRDEGYALPSGEVKEVKYTDLRARKQLRVARSGLDLFMQSDSWFRCIVVDQAPESGWSLDSFGSPSESRAIKQARFYNRCTETLLRRGIGDVVNAVLLADRMTRCAGDDFVRLIGDAFNASRETGGPPAFRSVHEVDTARERYHLGQISDLLIGAVLNELTNPRGRRGRFKRQFKEYAKNCLGADALAPESMPEREPNPRHRQFHVWRWPAP